MREYEVYGARLATEYEFPELPAAAGIAGDASWRFVVVDALPAPRGMQALGATHLYGAVHARLFSHADGHRITIDDTGTFDLMADRRTVRWERRDASWPEFVRAHCVGRVMATALFLDGLLPLHGSAVETADGVIAFLAPKGHGKSSLAFALTAAGARLVTDDTLPVELTADGPWAWPGVHSLRLRADALAGLAGLAAGGGTLDTREGKRVVGPFPPERLMRAPRALAAIYLLEAGAPDAPAAAARLRLPETLAAIQVVAHVKIGEMLGGSAAGALLARAAALVARVPVHHLAAARDLARLPDVAHQLLAWHGAP